MNNRSKRNGLDEAEQVEPAGGKRVEDADAQVVSREVLGEEHERDHVCDAVRGGRVRGADEECEPEASEGVQHTRDNEEQPAHPLGVERAHHRNQSSPQPTPTRESAGRREATRFGMR